MRPEYQAILSLVWDGAFRRRVLAGFPNSLEQELPGIDVSAFANTMVSGIQEEADRRLSKLSSTLEAVAPEAFSACKLHLDHAFFEAATWRLARTSVGSSRRHELQQFSIPRVVNAVARELVSRRYRHHGRAIARTLQYEFGVWRAEVVCDGSPDPAPRKNLRAGYSLIKQPSAVEDVNAQTLGPSTPNRVAQGRKLVAIVPWPSGVLTLTVPAGTDGDRLHAILDELVASAPDVVG